LIDVATTSLEDPDKEMIMISESISCPYCGKSIPLSEAISHEVEAKLQNEMLRRESDLEKKYQLDLSKAVQKAAHEAKATAESELGLEVETLKGQLSQQEGKLKQARVLEIKLRHERQSLEEQKAEVELRVAREIDEQRKEIEEKTLKRVEAEQNLVLREKDQLLEQMKRRIEDLKRKAEQGSQQLQGEVLELALEERLSLMFPLDNFKPVPKGVNGADLIQEVCDRTGVVCGLILWETKRTKNWSEGWLGKLKADQLAAKADVALLLTQALPRDCERFQQIDGLWVTSYACAFDLALVLRKSLIEVAKARRAARGKNEKMEIVYDYLSSPQFGTRVESVLNMLVSLKSDLDGEKRAYAKIWSKRQTQIEGVIGSMAHIVGDLQAIGDLSLGEVKSLSFPQIEDVELGIVVLQKVGNLGASR
jgi:hypothetical protein